MADPRPYVVNAKVINLLNSAPVANMRPSLGSFVQRKTIDIGCYPFPFMVNSENVPLDGRTISVNGESIKLPVRLVPFWCSENSYADYYGDPTYNNGKITWQGGFGTVKSNIEGNNIGLSASFAYDPVLGVTFPLVRYNTAFIGMDKTVPTEWIRVKDAVLGTADGLETVRFLDTDGETLGIANNILFKAWSGLTFDVSETGVSGTTYQFLLMERFNSAGGTYSPLMDRYNYGCLDQIFNSDRFAVVGLEPNVFWEGNGVSFGVSGGMTGELFLLNALTGADQSGSYYVTPGATIDFPYDLIFAGLTSGTTLSGTKLAVNLYSLASEVPFLGSRDPKGGFVDTLALLLGTNQKIVTLATGGTASLRALDFNNPCSASFVYREDTELGRWGYEVDRIPIGSDIFDPGPPPEIGCNVPTFIDYISGLNGSTGRNHGIYHPLSWMFWKGISFDGEFREYRLGYIHDFVGLDEDGLEPVYNKLEGIHDHLCYEYYEGTVLKSRVYYPVRPITKTWYDANVAPGYTLQLGGLSDVLNYGSTLEKKYDIGFDDNFKGPGSVETVDGIVSLRNLDDDIDGITIEFPNNGTNGLNGVTGFLFPYFTPLASFAMNGIMGGSVPGGGDIVISGEFTSNFGSWDKNKFGLQGETDPKLLYEYYADGVSSSADFSNSASSPYSVEGIEQNSQPNFRLFSWNALSRISPRDRQSPSTIVRSSFRAKGSDLYGDAYYTSGNKLTMDGADVDVDLKNYPPSSLPDTSVSGLEYTVTRDGTDTIIPLDCGGYINVVRYVNNTRPNQATVPGVFGLTASRNLIANVVLNATEKSFSEFDTTNQVDLLNGVAAENFDRIFGSPNNSTNFYENSNFFFTTDETNPSNTRNVFASRYYLTASEYQSKYGGGGGGNPEVNWWESVSNNNTSAIAQDIRNRLLNPIPGNTATGVGDFWTDLNFSSVFKGSQYQQSDLDVAGIQQALDRGLHPGFVYRIFTSRAMQQEYFDNASQNLIPYYSSCSQSWTVNGVPCDQDQDLIGFFYSDFTNYFQSGQTGCGQYGNTDIPDSSWNAGTQYSDIFFKCKVAVEVNIPGVPIEPPKYAYNESYYSPQIGDYAYQNQNCTAGSGVFDPPAGATLSAFGVQFADALNIIRVKSNQSAIDLSNAIAVRDVLFGFDGLTATIDGVSNDVGLTLVSNWLQGKMESVFDYYNANRTAPDGDLQKIEDVLTSLYSVRFPDYKSSFDSAKTYKLFAIKPKCVEEWTPECENIASSLVSTNSFRSSAFAPRDMFFSDDEVNRDASGRVSNPSILDYQPPIGSNSTVLTSNDIVPQNEGFVGAFRTVYIEPLGLAENVLATEIQAVPRATISSTVFGKISTVIDSGGFIRDVNVITFESGFGTKILGNNDTGSLTISVEGISMGSLTDTGISGPQDGDILVYDAELQRWVNRPFSQVVQPYMGFTGNINIDPDFYYQETPPDAGITIGTRWMDSNTGIEYIYVNDGDNDLWLQSSVDTTVETPTFVYETVLVEGATYQAFDTDYYIGVSYAGGVTITLPSDPEEGKTVVVKDASGRASYTNRSIIVVGATSGDRIDNQNHATINIDNGALQFIYKDGWRII